MKKIYNLGANKYSKPTYDTKIIHTNTGKHRPRDLFGPHLVAANQPMTQRQYIRIQATIDIGISLDPT